MPKVKILFRTVSSGFVGVDVDTKRYVKDIDLYSLKKDFPSINDVVVGDYDKNGVFVATETIVTKQNT